MRIWIAIGGLSVLLFAAPGCLAADTPTLKSKLSVRGGYAVLDAQATELDLGNDASAGAYRSCGLSPEAVRAELISHADRVLKQHGRVLDQLVAPNVDNKAQRDGALAELRELLKADQAAAELYGLDKDWPSAEPKFRSWLDGYRATAKAVIPGQRGLGDVYNAIVVDARWADGPLLPATDLFSPEDPKTQLDGVIVFQVAPPFRSSKLQPTQNRDEWTRHRSDLAQDLLTPFHCELWYRDRIVSRAKDYLEMRGVGIDAYRTRRDQDDSGGLGVETPPPDHKAGIAPERPSFRREGLGGRVLLSPDPLLDNVLVEASAEREWPALRRILYLLLPTADWNRIAARPGTFLCRTEAVWKPADAGGRAEAVRLDLRSANGSRLDFASVYITQRMLAERIQRLAALGYVPRLQFASLEKQRKSTSLIVARDENAAAITGAQENAVELPACPGETLQPRAEEQPGNPLDACERADIAEPGRTHSKSCASGPLRNNARIGVESSSGKPPRFFADYSRTGLDNEDVFGVRLATQREASGEVSYARDFAGFGLLERRVQLSARVFSDFTPDRPLAGDRVDERKNGFEGRAIVDLWRDWRGSFGQLNAGLQQREVELGASAIGAASTHIVLADAGLEFAKAADGTPASARLEGGASLAHGRQRETGATFGKLSGDIAYNRFLGAFTRWDLRANAAAVDAAAPQVEWPSFGGENSVRGYRTDSAIARRTWVVQNELWVPLSFVAGDNEALRRTLRRNAALALFADVGALHDSTSNLSGRKSAVGLGLRYQPNNAVVLRFDVAHATGGRSADIPGGSTHFYFTISTRRTL